jgi:hypothetical protein
MSDYGPSLKAFRLYKKTSAKGTVYFSGRSGNLKIVVLKSKDTADDGTEIWDVLYSQAQERPRESQSSYASRSPEPATRQEPAKPYVDREMKDEIPF